MEKISCDVIQDLLPLYIDHTASDDTTALVEAHLKSCDVCRNIYQETLSDISRPDAPAAGEPNAAELKQFRRFLRRRHLRTMLLSIAGALMLCIGLVTWMNACVLYIDCDEAGLTYEAENEDEVRFTDSIMGFYRWINELDRDTGTMTIHYEQSLWERFCQRRTVYFDHVQTFLKKDVIKVVYLDSDGTTTVIWEASEEEKEAYFSQELGPLG